jgi:UDP-N-acetylmuramoyl-L-alanyl-D-glutamate--2,6-diaminopimelate ligase
MSSVTSARPRVAPHVRLGDLAAWLGVSSPGAEDTVVTGVTLSSQRTLPGDLYVALPGSRAHGIAYAEQAREAGAVAVLTDPAGRAGAPDLPLLVVDHPRRLLGALSAHVHGDPATAMRMVGVTGTQGKTTTTRLLEGALQASGTAAGVIGTVGTRVAGADVKTTLTTPEAPDLHALFALMRERGVAACAMEVSSHALVMGRVDGVVFDVAVFLNLGRDHLDFHRDEEDYYRAKASLFTPERARLALVNLDDDHGRRLARETTLPLRTFSTEGRAADWTVTDVEPGPDGTRFHVLGPGGLDLPAGVPLPGAFNVSNALAAVAAAGEAGLDAAAVAAAIATSTGVPGRFERVEAGQPFTVVVDYAHKPDAVRAALQSLRPLTAGRLITVLGAGGDRDPGKRPLMGRIAAELSDVLVVTDDNPRTEDPAAIRAAMLTDVPEGSDVREVGDRRTAIATALDLAEPGDIVVVAGKGHESGQEVHGVVHPFDDREVARELLVTHTDQH